MAWLIELIIRASERLIKAAVILFTSSIFFVISVSMLALLLFVCVAVIFAFHAL